MESKFSQQTAIKKRNAAETSLDRIRRSIEGALEKEKQCVEKEALNQYIRDASIRMSLNLPIKPTQQHPKENPPKEKRHHGDYKLPSLQHGDNSPTKKPDEHILNVENTAVQSKVSTEAHSYGGSQNSLRLPPIVIDTGVREMTGKRKRKKDDSGQIDLKEQKRKSPKQVVTNLSKSRQGSSCDEELSVVMCGRSPINQDDRLKKDLFVSKHGRFKSK